MEMVMLRFRNRIRLEGGTKDAREITMDQTGSSEEEQKKWMEESFGRN